MDFSLDDGLFDDIRFGIDAVGMGFNSALAFTLIEESIDVFLCHEALLGLVGIIECLASDGFIKLS